METGEQKQTEQSQQSENLNGLSVSEDEEVAEGTEDSGSIEGKSPEDIFCGIYVTFEDVFENANYNNNADSDTAKKLISEIREMGYSAKVIVADKKKAEKNGQNHTQYEFSGCDGIPIYVTDVDLNIEEEILADQTEIIEFGDDDNIIRMREIRNENAPDSLTVMENAAYLVLQSYKGEKLMKREIVNLRLKDKDEESAFSIMQSTGHDLLIREKEIDVEREE